MPVLLLLRHAKSSWDDPALDDFDRPLAPRGLKAAPLMGAQMAARGWHPDLALVSPAARARQTWDLASAAFDPPPDTRFERSLYMASPAPMLKLLHALPDTAGSVLVVAHNPGLQNFALSLAGTKSDRKALRLIEEKFPTGALARFWFAGAWTALAPGAARLTNFVRPRDIG